MSSIIRDEKASVKWHPLKQHAERLKRHAKGLCHHCFTSTTAKRLHLCATTLSSPEEELLQLRLAAGGAEAGMGRWRQVAS